MYWEIQRFEKVGDGMVNEWVVLRCEMFLSSLSLLYREMPAVTLYIR